MLSVDPNELPRIALTLAQRVPQLLADDLYSQSLPYILSDVAFQFVVDRDERTGETSALALLRLYETPFDNKIVVAVEALWIDDDAMRQRRFWQQLADRFGSFKCMCVTARSVADPAALEWLRHVGVVGQALVRETPLILRPVGRPGLYSAFCDGPAPEQIDTTCLCLYSMAGTPTVAKGLLYRGDGRLKWAGHWEYETLEELAAALCRDGFPARRVGSFGGTVRDQISHQGYVDSATVSLTASREVGAVYATESGAHPGIVFAIDPARLRSTGEVYDSYATMVRYCNWIQPDVFDGLRALIVSFGSDRDGLRGAGAFLKDLDERARRASLMLPAPPSAELVPPEAVERAERAGVSVALLEHLFEDLRGFWASSTGGGALEVTVTADGNVVETPMEAHVYIAAFAHAQPELEAAYTRRLENGGDPGWDLTPLGYITKTCRDEEFFSTGPIDGESIVAATIVDQRGKAARELDPERLRVGAR
jgi:hypothetical protein